VSEDPLYAQYEAAMVRLQDHPVRLECTLPEMSVIIAALQLALRHPLFPRASRTQVTAFVQGFIAQVKTLDLVIAQVLERGNDPHHDVPARRRKGRR
jgi:hypothetical protein